MVFTSRLCLSSADATAASMAPEHNTNYIKGFLRVSRGFFKGFDGVPALASADATAASMAPEHNSS